MCKQQIQPDFASVGRASSFLLLLDYGVFECTAHNIQHGTWSLISYSNSSLLIFMFLCTHMVDYMGCFLRLLLYHCHCHSISAQFTSFRSYPFIFNSCPPFEHHTSPSLPSIVSIALLLFVNPYPSVTLQNVIVVKNRRHLYGARLPFHY